jgi:hypothetical protein
MGSHFTALGIPIAGAFALAACVAIGCAGAPAGPGSAGGDRMQYRGFSIPRPASGWYLRDEEQAPSQAVVRYETRGSDTHGFLVAIDLRFVGSSPKSHEELARVARADEIENEARFTRLQYEQRLTTRQGQWCIEYESRVLDRFPAEAPPGVALHVRARGTRCLHPAWPGTLIDIVWMEQGRPEELDDALARDAEAYLAGAQIETAPGVAARDTGAREDPQPTARGDSRVRDPR